PDTLAVYIDREADVPKLRQLFGLLAFCVTLPAPLVTDEHARPFRCLRLVVRHIGFANEFAISIVKVLGIHSSSLTTSSRKFMAVAPRQNRSPNSTSP